MIRNCGPGTCEICGQVYQKQTANSRSCSDECRRELDNRRKRINKGPIRENTNTCVACGKKFAGKLPNYPYKCCGAPECRTIIRKQGGKASAKTVAARKRAVTVACLKCGRSWKSPSRFIRVCPECKRNQAIHPIYSEVWGRNAI